MTRAFERSRITPKIGEAIRSYREALGLSLTGLAADIGVSGSHLGRVERNLVNPSYEIVTKLCDRLGINILELGDAGRQSRDVDEQLAVFLKSTGFSNRMQQEIFDMSLRTRQALLAVLACKR